MVQALRQLGHQDVRVGFVTTERTPALLEEAISNGALFILHKPFNDAELVAVVANAVKDLVQASHSDGETQATAAEDLEGGDGALALLLDHLGNIPFRLIPNDKMAVAHLTTNNLLGLYSVQERKGVYAIGIMEANAVCMVGGGAARMSPQEVRAAMMSGQPTTVMMDKAHEFLKGIAASLGETAPEPITAVTLAKASVVKN
eukprot:gene29570-30013_t